MDKNEEDLDFYFEKVKGYVYALPSGNLTLDERINIVYFIKIFEQYWKYKKWIDKNNEKL